MAQQAGAAQLRPMRLLPKDLGVALVVLLALGLALVLRGQTEGRTSQFQTKDMPLAFSYPADWREAGTLDNVLLNIQDPYVDSAFKTTLTVESRQLDPASPPTLEELTNRRVDERSQSAGYHFLSSQPAKVGGADGTELEYAYVVQPIDEPRRASMPVVVHAREYVVRAADRSYYFLLAAPEDAFERASKRMDDLIASVKL